MSVQIEGKVGKRYLIRESDPKVRLVFRGKDAKRFTQLDPPKKGYEKVEFSLTVADLAELGLPLPESKEDLRGGSALHANRGIGFLKDSAEIVARAAVYLQEFEERIGEP